MSVLRDLIVVLDFLSSQKTFPPQVQAAMDRLRTVDRPKLPIDDTKDLFPVQSTTN